MFLLFQNAANQKVKYYYQGICASIPIVLGYFPVALAFGLAAKSAGFTSIEAAMISAMIFAGASQFALVGLVSSGASIIVASVVCFALNARHLVYGPSLSMKLKNVEHNKIPLVSFGLTDEVFSTALSELERIKGEAQISWLLGLETGAYFTWVFSTWLGAFSGDVIIDFAPILKIALSFSLPALFLTLLVLMINKKTIVPVIVVALFSVGFIKCNLTNYTILTASVIGPVTWLILKRIR